MPQPSSLSVAQLMAPRSVAVIGASEDQTKFGGRLYRMLLKHGFAGTVYPINPGRDQLFGIRTFPSVRETPEAPDMVVMALPRDKVKAEIEAAAERGARCAIVITSKFSDAGPEGAALEREIVATARAHGMRLIGPNCLGLISPANRVILSSSPALDVDSLPVGRIGFISQSGALMATVFDRALAMGVGFSHAVSVGNQADLELADFLEVLVDDPRTTVLCSYIEGLKNASRFVAVAHRAQAAGKPFLVVKSGRTEAGSAAAFSHTASIAGSHAVFEAVCREEGVTLLDETGTMITLAATMTRHPGATVRTAAIVTTSGGAGALAADALTVRGVPLARFTAQTRARLDEFYPSGQANNPVDLGGRKSDEAATVSRSTATIVGEDGNTDAVLHAVTTAPMLTQLVQELAAGMHDASGREIKPAFYVMQPGHAADGARRALCDQGLSFTDSTVEAMDALAAWCARTAFRPRVAAMRPGKLERLPALRQQVFDEAGSKALLARYGVPVNQAGMARTRDEAAALARQLGLPAVLKIVSPDVVHKSDAGGVLVGLGTTQEVAAGFDRILANVRAAHPTARIDAISVQPTFRGRLELMVGARRDPQFGPVVVIGAGGVLVELLPARSIVRAPVAQADALQALQRLPLWPVLEGYRGSRLAVEAVVEAIERVSWLAHDLAAGDFELDVNPLLVNEQGCCAVDARLRIG